jgi:hypothetical protein
LCTLTLKALSAAENTDSQSGKTVEESACPGGYGVQKTQRAQAASSGGYLGLLLSVYITPAKVKDRIGALFARRDKGAFASFEENLGRWSLYGREVG